MRKIILKLAILFPALFVVGFICLCLMSVYPFLKRHQPVLHHSSFLFIQNPFRDKTKEIVANNFFYSMKNDDKQLFNGKYPKVIFRPCAETEKGELADWELENRFDDNEITSFAYRIFRKNPDPKRGPKLLLSWATLKLKRENNSWEVQDYKCDGVSWNDWYFY